MFNFSWIKMLALLLALSVSGNLLQQYRLKQVVQNNKICEASILAAYELSKAQEAQLRTREMEVKQAQEESKRRSQAIMAATVTDQNAREWMIDYAIKFDWHNNIP